MSSFLVPYESIAIPSPAPSGPFTPPPLRLDPAILDRIIERQVQAIERAIEPGLKDAHLSVISMALEARARAFP